MLRTESISASAAGTQRGGRANEPSTGMSERLQLGDTTLDLLTADGTLAILRELRSGPVRAGDIELRIPGLARWTALRRLQSLVCNGFVSVERENRVAREHSRPISPRAPFALTGLGRELLLEVSAAAVRCEQAWRSPPEPPVEPGLGVLKLVADRHTRELARALADAPLRSTDLLVRLPDLGRSTLLRRLRTLHEDGVLVREKHGREVRYALADSARHLAIVALRAARCEWLRATPSDRALSGDLPGLVHVLAPVGRIALSASGTCRLHLESKATPEADIYLTASSGKIAALAAAPIVEPQAAARATPEVLCEALFRSDPSMITTSGDHVLITAVFNALSTALHA